jgi:hypothetical protein
MMKSQSSEVGPESRIPDRPEHEGVRARTAIEHVHATTAGELVVAAEGLEDVVALAARELVIAAQSRLVQGQIIAGAVGARRLHQGRRGHVHTGDGAEELAVLVVLVGRYRAAGRHPQGIVGEAGAMEFVTGRPAAVIRNEARERRHVARAVIDVAEIQKIQVESV